MAKFPDAQARLSEYIRARRFLDRNTVAAVRWPALQTAQTMKAAVMEDQFAEMLAERADTAEADLGEVMVYLAQIGALVLWLDTGGDPPEDWSTAEQAAVRRLLGG